MILAYCGLHCPSLTVDSLEFLDVVEYSVVVDDQEREDDEVVSSYDGRVTHNQLPQLSPVHVDW